MEPDTSPAETDPQGSDNRVDEDGSEVDNDDGHDNDDVLDDPPSSGVHLSKNQMKRLKRAERMEQAKRAKKLAEKERKKANKRKLHEENAETGPPVVAADSHANVLFTDEERQHLRKQRKLQASANFIDQCNTRFTVVVDCDFESCHTERPLKSLAQQLAFCYGFNRRAPNPVHLYFTGLGPKLHAQMAKSKCEGWQNLVMTNKCYTELPEFCKSAPTQQLQTSCSAATENGSSSSSSSFESDVRQCKQLVYLTADADEVISEFDPNCAYIIGGIVDRNRYKGITHKKALEQGIRTAKLPIREYISMVGTPVLTVNHVFEIMLLFDQTRCWKTTLEKVLPQRKDPKLKGENDETENDEDLEVAEGATDET